jgi:hypothetical protein
MADFRVEKDPSGYHLRWQVRDGAGKMVSRFETRRVADALCAVLNGNRHAARELYRLVVARELKRHPLRGDALRAAALTMYTHGIGPIEAGAHPETFEPTEDADAA